MNIFHKWGKNQVQKAFDEMKKKKKNLQKRFCQVNMKSKAGKIHINRQPHFLAK